MLVIFHEVIRLTFYSISFLLQKGLSFAFNVPIFLITNYGAILSKLVYSSVMAIAPRLGFLTNSKVAPVLIVGGSLFLLWRVVATRFGRKKQQRRQRNSDGSNIGKYQPKSDLGQAEDGTFRNYKELEQWQKQHSSGPVGLELVALEVSELEETSLAGEDEGTATTGEITLARDDASSSCEGQEGSVQGEVLECYSPRTSSAQDTEPSYVEVSAGGRGDVTSQRYEKPNNNANVISSKFPGCLEEVRGEEVIRVPRDLVNVADPMRSPTFASQIQALKEQSLKEHTSLKVLLQAVKR